MEIGIVGLCIIVLNLYVSYRGLKDHAYFNRYSFEVDEVLVRKDYKRLVSSGFLHVSWLHLGFNMFSLYAFSDEVEAVLSPMKFLFVYMVSLIGGNLFSLYVHRKHGDYSAVGASGAVCG